MCPISASSLSSTEMPPQHDTTTEDTSPLCEFLVRETQVVARHRTRWPQTGRCPSHLGRNRSFGQSGAVGPAQVDCYHALSRSSISRMPVAPYPGTLCSPLAGLGCKCRERRASFAVGSHVRSRLPTVLVSGGPEGQHQGLEAFCGAFIVVMGRRRLSPQAAPSRLTSVATLHIQCVKRLLRVCRCCPTKPQGPLFPFTPRALPFQSRLHDKPPSRTPHPLAPRNPHVKVLRHPEDPVEELHRLLGTHDAHVIPPEQLPRLSTPGPQKQITLRWKGTTGANSPRG